MFCFLGRANPEEGSEAAVEEGAGELPVLGLQHRRGPDPPERGHGPGDRRGGEARASGGGRAVGVGGAGTHSSDPIPPSLLMGTGPA